MLISVIGWAILGTIAGFAASKMVNLRGDDPRMGIALGGVGAVICGWLYSVISGTAMNGFNIWSLLVAAVGAVAALAAWHAWRKSAA
jgi:uncharacterized membrane protein YeaQ/YmgE (transglycosylase-associated protein family)